MQNTLACHASSILRHVAKSSTTQKTHMHRSKQAPTPTRQPAETKQKRCKGSIPWRYALHVLQNHKHCKTQGFLCFRRFKKQPELVFWGLMVPKRVPFLWFSFLFLALIQCQNQKASTFSLFFLTFFSLGGPYFFEKHKFCLCFETKQPSKT